MAMKIKDVPPELAKVICLRTRKKYNDGEQTCKNCPLYIPNSEYCFMTIIDFIHIYGNKELKKYESN